MTLTVNPDTLFNASVRFLDLRTGTDRLLGGLISALAPTAGMAGADSLGQQFADGYDKAARQAAAGLAKLDVHLGQISAGLLGTATNYWRADAGSNMQVPIDVGAPAQQLQCDNARAFREEEVATAQGEGVGVWDIVADTALSTVWPQGDTDKMRQAGHAWEVVAQRLSELNVEVSNAVAMVTGPNSGDTINAFAAHCAQLVDRSVCYTAPTAGGAAIPNLQALCGQLAKYCNTAGEQIDQARTRIKWLLVAAGAATVAGVALTVVTLGISDEGAAVLDAAAIGEAESIVAAASAEIEAEMAASMIAQIEGYLASLATIEVGPAALTIVGVVTVVGGTAIVLGDGSTAYASPAVPARTPAAPVGPYPPLTPAQIAGNVAWQGTLPQRPTAGAPGDPRHDYQERVAGPTEYRMPAGNGESIWADGYRPIDGAAVDAKYTGNPSCTPFSLDNATGRPDFVYENVLADIDSEVRRYGGAITVSGGHVRFLEIRTNTPETVPYFLAIMAKYHVPGDVIVVP